MDNTLKLVIDRIVRTAKPQRIVLFGSRARGRHNKDSDYDLCVLKPGVANRRELAQRIYRKLGACNAAVDVIVETPERFAVLAKNRHLIYRHIARQGKVVYER